MLEFFFRNLRLSGTIACMILLFVPMPPLMVDILYAIVWVLSIFVLCITIKYSEDFLSLPRVLLFLSLWILAIAISFTRTILDNTRSVLYKYIEILNFNSVVNIVLAVVLLTGTYILVKRGAGRVVETAARFSLDTMPQQMFDVDNRLSKGEITPEEAAEQKDKIRKDIDFCSNMDGSTKFIAGLAKALIFMYIVSMLGGCLVNIFYNNMTVWQAIFPVSFISLLNVVLGVVPIILESVAVVYAIRH
ncbi:MAG: FHIPEP family type III secretion protein [Treponema sp.]|nr:FHIPEP family type III secretion protein [Treponema sp.]